MSEEPGTADAGGATHVPGPAAVAGAVREWCSQPLWSLPDGQVREATREAFALLQSAQAGYLRLVAELDARPGAVAGARAGETAKSFLVGALHRTPGQAGADVRAGHALWPRDEPADHSAAPGADLLAGSRVLPLMG